MSNVVCLKGSSGPLLFISYIDDMKIKLNGKRLNKKGQSNIWKFKLTKA